MFGRKMQLQVYGKNEKKIGNKTGNSGREILIAGSEGRYRMIEELWTKQACFAYKTDSR